MPKAEEDHSSEDVPQRAEGNPLPSREGVSQEAGGNLGSGLTQPTQACQEDTPVRHLDLEEMLRGVDEVERLREDIGRIRNKSVMTHWKQRHSFTQTTLSCVL